MDYVRGWIAKRTSRSRLPSGTFSNWRSPQRSRSASGTYRGMVLILVLVVVAALSLAALTFSEWMLTERQASNVAGRQAKARVLAESGMEAVLQALSMDPQAAADAGGWYDNPDLFCGVLVADADLPRDRGRFTVVSPLVDLGEYSGVRYGLQNESAKLNLNTLLLLEKTNAGAPQALLMGLPGMAEEIADSILDWLDEDDEPRTNGAEVDYYSALDPPYAPANGPLTSLDELLMVRGVTPELLFGVDTNRNEYADDTESDPSMLATVDASLEPMDCGWSAYLTLYSLEGNLQPDGQPKINVNQDDLQALSEQLDAVLEPDWAKFILAYRQQQKSNSQQQSGADQQNPDQPAEDGGPSPNEPEQEKRPGSEQKPDEGGGQSSGDQPSQKQPQTASLSSGELDLTQPAQTKLASILDLIDSKIQVKFQGQQQAVQVESPFLSDAAGDYLSTLMDVLSTEDSAVTPGRININEAPRALLAAIPGMPAEAVDAIVAQRQPAAGDAESEFRHATWLLTEGIVDLDQMKQLLPLVTGGGNVYRAQVVGFFDQDGPAARLEAVFDATQSPARIVFWRELTPLGRGYPLEILGADMTAE